MFLISENNQHVIEPTFGEWLWKWEINFWHLSSYRVIEGGYMKSGAVVSTLYNLKSWDILLGPIQILYLVPGYRSFPLSFLLSCEVGPICNDDRCRFLIMQWELTFLDHMCRACQTYLRKLLDPLLLNL